MIFMPMFPITIQTLSHLLGKIELSSLGLSHLVKAKELFILYYMPSKSVIIENPSWGGAHI